MRCLVLVSDLKVTEVASFVCMIVSFPSLFQHILFWHYKDLTATNKQYGKSTQRIAQNLKSVAWIQVATDFKFWVNSGCFFWVCSTAEKYKTKPYINTMLTTINCMLVCDQKKINERGERAYS